LDENKFIKNSVLDVVKKYFNMISIKMYQYRYKTEDKRIMNMALTSDQISEAYEVLRKLKELVSQLKDGKVD